MDFSGLGDQVGHIVQPCGESLAEELGGGQGSLGKEGAVVGLVLEGDGLVGGADDDLMLTHDVAHADGVDTDLLGGALAVAAPSRDHGGLGAHLTEGVGDGQSGAAGGVQLAVVVTCPKDVP